MKPYRHFARAQGDVDTPHGTQRMSAVGWSRHSAAEAEAMAEQRLSRLRAALAGGFPSERDYAYLDDRPLVEPVLKDVVDGAGRCLGVITRNGYGAQVLNTDRALFIDVDFASAPAATGFFARLFPSRPEQRALEAVEHAARRFPHWAFQVYRTHAGLRVVLLNETLSRFEPSHLDVLEAFGSDPMYTRLCQSQRTFRARLTPKPWRIGLERPWVRFPFADSSSQARFETWLERYESAATGYAVCQPLSRLGLGAPTESVACLLGAHDALVLRPGAPLG